MVNYTLPAGPLKRIHIDKAAQGAGSPDIWVIRVANLRYHGASVMIHGESVCRYSPDQPLKPEGTYAWVETYAALAVHAELTDHPESARPLTRGEARAYD